MVGWTSVNRIYIFLKSKETSNNPVNSDYSSFVTWHDFNQSFMWINHLMFLYINSIQFWSRATVLKIGSCCHLVGMHSNEISPSCWYNKMPRNYDPKIWKAMTRVRVTWGSGLYLCVDKRLFFATVTVRWRFMLFLKYIHSFQNIIVFLYIVFLKSSCTI